jgi:hypothetical protein
MIVIVAVIGRKCGRLIVLELMELKMVLTNRPLGHLQNTLDASNDNDIAVSEVTAMTAMTAMTASCTPSSNTNVSLTDDPDEFLPALEKRITEKFHDPRGNAYATFTSAEGLKQIIRVDSQGFRDIVSKVYYEKTGKGISSFTLDGVVSTVTARARFEGPEHSVFIRVGESTSTGAIEVDLGDASGLALKIDAAGARVAPPSCRFIRPAGMQPLPIPDVAHGDIKPLWNLINVPGETERVMLASWLVMALHPKGPYPVLILQGEQGSAKTTAMNLLRGLIDPCLSAARSLPRTEQDLFIAASRSWVCSFDNLSGLKGDLSDAFCRLSTGGEFATRKLYTNDEESIHQACRPVIFNGIDDIVTRQDLLSRSLVVHLPVIPTEKRRTSQEVNEEFTKTRPLILGGLLKGLSAALGEKQEKIPLVSRLADFLAFASRAEVALGFQQGALAKAMTRAQKETTQMVLELDPVASAIIDFMATHHGNQWKGSAAWLFEKVEPTHRPYNWPKTASMFSQHLTRIAPAMRSVGIEFDRDRTKDARQLVIRRR